MRRLSVRLRLLLAGAFVIGVFLPPYIPQAALAGDGNELPPSQFLFVEDGFLMKTSALGQQGTRLAYSEGLLHTVQTGETMDAIAKRYGISSQTIQWVNGLTGKVLKPGQELVILPVDGVLHTVRRGQTLGRIAQLYDIPADVIARQNNIKGGFIIAGQELIVPGGKPIGNPDLIAGSSAIDPANLTPEQKLQFANKLPSKDIAFKFGKPLVPPTTGPTGTRSPPAVAAVVTSGILQMPCNKCAFTQYYHAGHYAVDIQTRGGGPNFAAEAGTVIRADYGWNGGYGNVVEIDHGNGLVTLYGHNKELYVKKGDKVERGQTIGFMGNTGFVYGVTGIHVHFEVRVNGVKKNPLLYLEG
ncbi:MAG: peptidase family protein [Candidatus Peribacteria bacterium]|nr:peptidase family protein [Candidatus Peribacteria bacterium]